MTCFILRSHGHKAVGGEIKPKSPDKLSRLNVVSPYFLPEREVGSRKVSLNRRTDGMRVWDCGKSKCHPVMGRIQVRYPVTRKRGQSNIIRFLRKNINSDPFCPRSADVLETSSAVAHVGRTSLRFVHRMRNASTGEPVASLSQMGVHLDLDTRRPAPLPEPLATKARGLLAL